MHNISLSFIFNLVNAVLYVIGFCLYFKKTGVDQKKAFVPFGNLRTFAECVDCERDGLFWMVSCAALYISTFIIDFSSVSPLLVRKELASALISTMSIWEAVFMVSQIAYLIFTLRIGLALIEIYGKKTRWIVPWVIAPGLILIIWNLRDGFAIPEGTHDVYDIFRDKGEGRDLSINIRKRTASSLFKQKILLKDISLTIPNGHMVLLLGGSGAGKTTFLNAVTGYEKADADILIGDRNVYSDYRYMKYDIGFVPQLDLMRGTDTVYRTVTDAAAVRLPFTMKQTKKDERINGVLEKFGLGSVKNSLVEKLSGGQRKRLSIAMEYISNPSLFILDEPDSGLDGVMARELFENLRSIADSNKIVIVITHTPDRVIDLFDDVIVLAKDKDRTGRLAYYGPVKEAYDFFGKDSMEHILRSINQKDEGGEGRADEFIEKYSARASSGKEVRS